MQQQPQKDQVCVDPWFLYSLYLTPSLFLLLMSDPDTSTTFPPSMTLDELRALIHTTFTIQADEIPSNDINVTLLTSEKQTKIIKSFKLSSVELEITSLEEAVVTKLSVKDFL